MFSEVGALNRRKIELFLTFWNCTNIVSYKWFNKKSVDNQVQRFYLTLDDMLVLLLCDFCDVATVVCTPGVLSCSVREQWTELIGRASQAVATVDDLTSTVNRCRLFVTTHFAISRWKRCATAKRLDPTLRDWRRSSSSVFVAQDPSQIIHVVPKQPSPSHYNTTFLRYGSYDNCAI